MLFADILGLLAKQYWLLQNHSYSINPFAGLLKIIDSTYVRLPKNASTWTAISKDSSGGKTPSTTNIGDSDVVNYLIDADRATYVMDRGYGHKTKTGGWLERKVNFVVRVKKPFTYEILRFDPCTISNMTKFYIVSIMTRKDKLRLIEFIDADGTVFTLLINRRDLLEEELLETYKNRWYIELFFKWLKLKQHIKSIICLAILLKGFGIN